MTTRKILWATDFSDAAAAALPRVKDIVQRDGAEVHLLYVTDDLQGFETYWGSGPDGKHRESLRSFAERTAKMRLQDICACELEGCPDYHLHFAHGDAAAEILAAAERLGVDLIVAARPPAGSDLSFGAAVDKVARTAKVEVLAVDAPPPSGPPACG